MKIFQRLLGGKPNAPRALSEIGPNSTLHGGSGGDIDLYYAALREARPYVIAMREVAADSMRSQ